MIAPETSILLKVPCIEQALVDKLHRRPVLYLSAQELCAALKLDGQLIDSAPIVYEKTRRILDLYELLVSSSDGHFKVALKMVEMGLKLQDLDWYNIGVSLPLREALRCCRMNAPTKWPAAAYILVGREDLAQQGSERPRRGVFKTVDSDEPTADSIDSGERPNQDTPSGIDFGKLKVAKLRFRDDDRLAEACKLLCSSTPTPMRVPEASENRLV